MTFLQMSLSGGLLILAAAFVRCFALHRLPKRTFLILWEIALLRLLVPFSVPSFFSVWSLIRLDPALHPMGMEASGGMFAPGMSGQMTAVIPAVLYADPGGSSAESGGPSLPGLWLTLWAVGFGVFALYFLISWLRWRREFAVSLPVADDFIQTWLHAHPLPRWQRRKIQVRCFDRIQTPLTYGIFRPVILLPKNIRLENRRELSFVLLHELVHIRRYDALVKFFAALALCIHWFNPAVYMMYLLLVRDLELSCDEAVVRTFEKDCRSAYALTLIAMEETKSRPLPFGNRFCQNAMKERITSIMKIRNMSFITPVTAAVLIIGIASVFATSVAGKNPAEAVASIPDTTFSEEEYAQLLALRFDGYKRMTVSEYQQKVWEMTDTPEYRDLLERFSQDEELQALQDENEIAAFLHYVLNPLTGDRWQRRAFAGYAASDFPAPAENALLEYNLTLSIQDSRKVTVQQYDDVRTGVAEGLRTFLHNCTKEELSNERFMGEQIRQETERLISRWSMDALQIALDTSYLPLSDWNGSNTENSSSRHTPDIPAEEHREEREYPNATKADYQALFTLMTDSYLDLPVRDFNKSLLEWGNEDSEGCLDRIFGDVIYGDCQVALTLEEQNFVETSLRLSSMENAKFVQSHYTGRPEEDPVVDLQLPPKQTADGTAFCDLYCQFSWQIKDKSLLTVRERDQAVAGLLAAVQDFWEEKSLDEAVTMTKEEVVTLLGNLARKHSTDQITLSTREEYVGFETMDERGLRN